MKTFSYVAACAALGSVLFGVAPVQAQAVKDVTIGTGAVSGVYFPAGTAMCRVINSVKKNNIRCKAEATGGSVANMRDLADGRIDIGMAQSDVQYFAMRGEGDFKTRGPSKELRALFSLYPEAVTILARNDANIKTWSDTKGKRFQLGELGSGNRLLTKDLLKYTGMKESDFQPTPRQKSAEMAEALCNNEIDAFTFVVGHPSVAIKEAQDTCKPVLVGFSDEQLNKIIKGAPYYARMTIPENMYGENPAVKTFGVVGTVVANSDMSERTAYLIVKTIFENLDELAKQHPALTNLKPEYMIKGNTVPYHVGALRYYRERGWMK